MNCHHLPPISQAFSFSRWVGPQVYIVYNGWLWLVYIKKALNVHPDCKSDHFNFKKLSANISVHMVNKGI